MNWHNEPRTWDEQDGTLRLTTDADTDFWCKTHYGIEPDSGHFCYREQAGSFTAEVRIVGQYRDQYDQAGLMVRVDRKNWIKCGIELIDGVQHVGAVVTRDFSDWSVQKLPQNPAAIWLRVVRVGSAAEIQYSLDGKDYALLRLAYLPMTDSVSIGMMAASPQGKGFSVAFEGFSVSDTTAAQLCPQAE